MTAQEKISVKHGSIAAALTAAQMQMGKALKSANNPHFRSKYADLGSVMDACLPALNANGIAVIQPTTDDETGRYVETVFVHGESGQELRCRVPLIVQKNDMQGYGSAVTYARRYGLMSMAGIAPEDDDGNAAARAAPKHDDMPARAARISADEFIALRDLLEKSAADEAKFCEHFGVQHIEELPQGKFGEADRLLRMKVKQKGGDA